LPADHALGAADDAQRAEGALVDVALATRQHGRQRGGEREPIEPMSGGTRHPFGLEAERMD